MHWQSTIGSYPDLNTWSGSAWQLVSMSANYFSCFYVCCTSSLDSAHEFFMVMGQNEYATLAGAQAEDFSDLSQGDFAFQEFVVLAKVIVEAKNSFSTTGKAQITQVDRITESRASTAESSVDNHNSLSGLQGGAASEYYHLTATELTNLGTAITHYGLINEHIDWTNATQNLVTTGLIRSTDNVYAGNATLTTDDQFYMGTVAADEPKINFDSTDYISYDRGSNLFTLYIGGVSQLVASDATFNFVDNIIRTTNYGRFGEVFIAEQGVAAADQSNYGQLWVKNDTPNNLYFTDDTGQDVQITDNGSLALADNSVTLAKMAGGTDGNLITYDASGDPAYVSTGTSGQVLTSNGAGAAPTFQDAASGVTRLYKSGAYTAVAGDEILADSAVAAITITLPASPSTDDYVKVMDCGQNATTNNITIARNGSTINGAAEDFVIDEDMGGVELIYSGTTWEHALHAIGDAPNPTQILSIACSDETTDLATGTGKAEFQIVHGGFTLTAIYATVTTAPTGSTLIVDVNDDGTSIMTTNKLSIKKKKKTTDTAATGPTLTTTSLAENSVMTVDIDQVGSTVAGAGLKVYLIGYWT
jgi:hypothetical protein